MKFVEWAFAIGEKKREVLIGSVSIFAGICLLIAYFQSGANALRYMSAEERFEKWSQAPKDEGLFSALKQEIRSLPDLQRRYEAAIAQKLIDIDRMEEALVLATRSLKRIESEVPFHALFAETSLLIERGQYQKALEMAVSLKEKMGPSFGEKEGAGTLVYLHNLLRIACLQRELENSAGEQASWEELEQILARKTRSVERFAASFTEGQASLSQFIQLRKEALAIARHT